MAEQANVLVRNKIQNQTEGQDVVTVIREYLGNDDFTTQLARNSEEAIVLQDTDVSLVIKAPSGIDSKLFRVNIDASVDVDMKYCREEGNWKFNLPSNSELPEVPTTVNIEIGDSEPD